MSKKINTLLSLAVCIGVFSTASQAITTTNNMTLQWQGTVPTKPTASGGLSFVSPLDPSQPFVPTIGTVSISDNGTDDGKVFTLAPVSFGIKTSSKLTAGSKIKAYLASSERFTGLNAVAGSSATPKLKLSIGSEVLKVGSSAAIDAVDVIGTTTDYADISISGTGELPDGTFTEGDNFMVTSTVVFTADVT
ncbi:hypothetical protein [Hafnia paralvei]|uniref:hypothetical protein n=1 Tax=Hafnia paralvei TaxID=546367 RepID=UPI001CCB5F31|nr:hypothetical protein [Hafnia paralvei]UBM39789.1 hypothetical protein K9N75_15640 [Hafnia paralvei]